MLGIDTAFEVAVFVFVVVVLVTVALLTPYYRSRR